MQLNRTFLLGLGAQKAGSSWVHAYLNADPSSDFGVMKEYHVWDALTLPEMAHFDQRGRSALRCVTEAALRRALGRGPAANGLRKRLQSSPTAYFDYFAELLSRSGITLSGDITPSYAGLRAPILRQIRRGFEERQIDIKVVFLMRDPVSRCVSAAQMNRRKNNSREGVPLSNDLNSAVVAYAQSAEARIRSDYQATVAAVREVFDAEKIHLGFFETMHCEAEMTRLATFAGTGVHLEMKADIVNAFEKTETVSTRTRTRLRDMLSETYDFCAREFPETRTIWADLDGTRAELTNATS